MKFVVPLSIPATFDILLALKSFDSILIVGVPAQTADSNNNFTLFFLASFMSSSPCSKITALFAVTTCFPELRASNIKSLAVSTPPINSTRTSTSSFTTSNISLKIFTEPGLHRGLSRRAPIHDISQSEYSSLPFISCSYKPVATLPQPQIPIFNLAIINLI